MLSDSSIVGTVAADSVAVRRKARRVRIRWIIDRAHGGEKSLARPRLRQLGLAQAGTNSLGYRWWRRKRRRVPPITRRAVPSRTIDPGSGTPAAAPVTAKSARVTVMLAL